MKFPAKLNVPEVDVNPPALMARPFTVTALLPKASVPAPALVRLLAADEKVPPMVNVLAETVICRSAFIDIVPVPRFRLLVPAKVKLPFKASG